MEETFIEGHRPNTNEVGFAFPDQLNEFVGGLVGGVDAALYWSVGWLIDILDNTSPETLLRDHWHQLAGLAALLLVVRAVVMIGSAVIEQQVIVPRFYTMIRWQAFRRVIEQPYTFYQNDFAGRIATKIMQAGESTGDFIVTSLQAMWSFLTFVILTTTILTTLDWRMGVVVAVWGMGYAAIIRFLLPRLRRAGKENANERAVLNGRMVDIFTNILSVKLFDSRQREHGGIRQARTNYLSAVTHLTLNMPGKLTDSEFDTMREQPEAGASLLIDSQQVSALVLDVCLYHHEKVDGSGYPHGLAGEQISLLARMAAVCDVYDAVTSARPYKAGWEPAESIRKMAGWKGHFDERVFQAFVRTVGIYPTGSLVRLQSGRLGVVLEQHEQSLLTPMVKVFFSAKSKQPIPQEVIDLSKLVGRERIVGRESAADWGFRNLDELWTGLPQG